MKTDQTKTRAAALLVPLALAISLTGCGMTHSKSSSTPTSDSDSGNSSGVPSSGTRSVDDADTDTKQVSSGLLALITVKGEASDIGPGVIECGDGKDRERYFRMLHTWSVTPSADDHARLDEAVKDLKEELPRHGWEIMAYGPDGSRNKNLSLTADNDEKKFSVNVLSYTKDDPPKLMVRVISGCYEVPEGERVEHF